MKSNRRSSIRIAMPIVIMIVVVIFSQFPGFIVRGDNTLFLPDGYVTTNQLWSANFESGSQNTYFDNLQDFGSNNSQFCGPNAPGQVSNFAHSGAYAGYYYTLPGNHTNGCRSYADIDFGNTGWNPSNPIQIPNTHDFYVEWWNYVPSNVSLNDWVSFGSIKFAPSYAGIMIDSGGTSAYGSQCPHCLYINDNIFTMSSHDQQDFGNPIVATWPYDQWFKIGVEVHYRPSNQISEVILYQDNLKILDMQSYAISGQGYYTQGANNVSLAAPLELINLHFGLYTGGVSHFAVYNDDIALYDLTESLTTTSSSSSSTSSTPTTTSTSSSTTTSVSSSTSTTLSSTTNSTVSSTTSSVSSSTSTVSAQMSTAVDSGQGSVTPNCPNGCSETVGSQVTVTANPSSGWLFSGWSTQSGQSCSSNPCTFNMPNNQVTLKATFTQNMANLITNVASGSGSVSPNCPSGCQQQVGSSASVSATATSGWTFSSWTVTGASCSGGSSSNPCTFTMPNNDVTVSATFTQISISSTTTSVSSSTTITTLSSTTSSTVSSTTSSVSSSTSMVAAQMFTAVGSGQGSVTPNCPNGCNEGVGSQVTVTANPSSGWQFSSWSTQTGISCSTNPCTFSMPNNAVTLKATFTQLTQTSTQSSMNGGQTVTVTQSSPPSTITNSVTVTQSVTQMQTVTQTLLVSNSVSASTSSLGSITSTTLSTTSSTIVSTSTLMSSTSAHEKRERDAFYFLEFQDLSQWWTAILLMLSGAWLVLRFPRYRTGGLAIISKLTKVSGRATSKL